MHEKNRASTNVKRIGWVKDVSCCHSETWLKPKLPRRELEMGLKRDIHLMENSKKSTLAKPSVIL